jgi:hypothetical protein
MEVTTVYRTKRFHISALLLVSMIFSLLIVPAAECDIISTVKEKAEKIQSYMTRENAQKAVKWFTYGGIALGAVIGVATGGLGGLLIGGIAGAVVSVIGCNAVGVKPETQWEIVKPKVNLPWDYNRQVQDIGGATLPSASQVQISGNQEAVSSNPGASVVKEKYLAAYKAYTEAVQKGKSNQIVQKALETYKKAKDEFKKLFK